MSDKAEKSEILWEHKWLFVIIPINDDSYGGKIPSSSPYLCAYCKSCDTYYTNILHVNRSPIFRSHTGPAGLPKYGCSGPEGL